MHTTILPGYDCTPLFLRRWHPEAASPRGSVVLVHGYAEHGGRYAGFARALVARGFAVYAHDQRGHGRSGGPTVLPRAFDEYVADLHAVVRRARATRPAGPLFLIGHSMGGAVALLYVLEHGAAPAGLVLSSPMIRLPTPRLLQRASGLLGHLLPALPTTLLESRALSRDPRVVANLESDPLCFAGRVKARTGAAMVQATRRIDAQMPRLALPLLVFHGTADRVTDPAGSRALARRAQSPDATLRLYDGFYHETFRDPGGKRIFDDVARWLGERA